MLFRSKQGCGDEGETREAREGEQGKTRRRVSMGQRGDPGEIQGRFIDLGGSEFLGESGEEWRDKDDKVSQG